MMSQWEENEEIKIFQEYLRIPSVYPDIDYEPCVQFLQRQADSLGLKMTVYHPSLKTKPLCVITYPGTSPEMPSIFLTSHMDVVPVAKEHWTHDPFAADIDENGKIFARGSQDTKAIGTQYLAALRYFVSKKQQFKRTIHVSFTPEEEVSSVHGMKDFVETDEFKNLNIGFALDEGASMPNDEFMCFYGERSTWRINFVIAGTSGHGSLMLPDNAAVKLQKLLTKIMEFRQHELSRVDNDPLNFQTAGNATSVNVTLLNGGLKDNVIPNEFKLTIDMRVSLDDDHDDLAKMFDEWCKESGTGVTYSYSAKDPKYPKTPIDESNKFWVSFKSSFDELNLKINPIICSGATDSRFMRNVGVMSIGFAPLNGMPLLAHAHDEYVYADCYLKGIEIYKTIISNLANVD